MHATLPLLETSDFPRIRRGQIETLQVNLGYRCNQQCLHCHVNASPNRSESMSREVIDDVLAFLRAGQVKKLDLTGGAPELNPHFRDLLVSASELGVHVMDRCNLTVLSEPGQNDLVEFLAAHRVEVIASMPCYLQENVDGQRGKGVFSGSIAGIKMLNQQGYGIEGSELQLNLVYNPTGAFLPPPQRGLEKEYKTRLREDYGVEFNQLYTLTNMPIKRFGSTLISKGQFEDYMDLLKSAYRVENLANVMCRSLISVDWQGVVYDCDFNQMLDLPCKMDNRYKIHLKDLIGQNLEGQKIVVADHCYGCTAGQGSSCGGALD